jgi:uncharacterized protein (DUF427 family)
LQNPTPGWSTSSARRLERPPGNAVAADIDFGKLQATDTSTHCPFKGDASYWSVRDGAKDAMWAYQDPYDEMLEIKDHGAFYPNRVTIETA